MGIAENRRIWCEALRSGKYEQGIGQLNCDNRYCCWGVAMELNGVPKQRSSSSIVSFFYYFTPGDCYFCYPPTEYIFEKYGIDSKTMHELADANDNGKTFSEIADMIERLPLPKE